jgi:hypothetical protein
MASPTEPKPDQITGETRSASTCSADVGATPLRTWRQRPRQGVSLRSPRKVFMQLVVARAFVVALVSLTASARGAEASPPAPQRPPSAERSAIAQPSVPEPSPIADPEPEQGQEPATGAAAPVADTRVPGEPSEALQTKPTPPPYSLPWQLRPVIAATVVRADAILAMYEDKGGRSGRTLASGLIASYKIPGTGGPASGLMIVGRLMFVDDWPPATPPAGGAPPPTGSLAVVNPLLGAAYAMKLGMGFRTNFFFGMTAPIGMGGGASPDPGEANSRNKGVNARAALDSSLFSVNDLAVIPGVSFAYVGHNLTAQVEATLFQLTRVRGEAVQKESSKTNFTSGLHVGYFFHPSFSIGSELRYQRWINAPFAVENDPTGSLIDNLTVAIGPRFHVKAGPAWIRPGIAYWRGLDKPLAAATPNYNSVQFDVPVIF